MTRLETPQARFELFGCRKTLVLGKFLKDVTKGYILRCLLGLLAPINFSTTLHQALEVVALRHSGVNVRSRRPVLATLLDTTC